MLLLVGMFPLEPTAICCGDHFRCSLRAISRHNGSLNASLHDLGRVAQSQTIDPSTPRDRPAPPPFLRPPRLIVEGDRFSPLTIDLNDFCTSNLRDISSHSIFPKR